MVALNPTQGRARTWDHPGFCAYVFSEAVGCGGMLRKQAGVAAEEQEQPFFICITDLSERELG